MQLKIINLRLQPHFPEDNELMYSLWYMKFPRQQQSLSKASLSAFVYHNNI